MSEAAFPGGGLGTSRGISTREFFAAIAMQGLLSGPWAFENRMSISDISTYAVKQADGLIKQLYIPMEE